MWCFNFHQQKIDDTVKEISYSMFDFWKFWMLNLLIEINAFLLVWRINKCISFAYEEHETKTCSFLDQPQSHCYIYKITNMDIKRISAMCLMVEFRR